MSKTEATKRPPIQMLESEAERLTDLAISVQDRLPEVSALLIQEIGRAKMHGADRIPADVVTMHSTVRFTHSASGKDYSYKLVYPKDADIAAGRISILTPVGAGLIGLREGQSILWPDRDGNERSLAITSVSRET
ncbi:nucleoside diphosphate kinase regulator [uncultured Sphingopyxis sp.]|uniref:nucleoside diphosphate kinase regulator n=1 Tax=uncultured Sphingopyxis sp. TaxID=310581 RepID=UPI00259A6AA9|nr:nucleoside diphosphate kinase regulator [uncultured Sphingopyxis sp.]